MRLLFITQAVDLDEPTLSAYHDWVESIGGLAERTEVICLKKGRYSLPDTFRIHSLGKEDGVQSRLVYAWRFLCLAWKLRRRYEAVFVHMNQEYVLLAGPMWLFLRKRVYMWRNHYAGSLLTDIAALFCTKIFCTSKHSYTAKYKKTVLMPVGINFNRFAEGEALHAPRSILFFARMAPSKRPEMLIDALGEVLAQGVSFTASFYGSPLPSDITYYESLSARAESLGLHDRVQFHPGVPSEVSAAVFQAHDIFVNCSPSGMFDKMLFEAAASGCRVIAASDDFRDAAGEGSYAPDTKSLVERLIEALNEDEDSQLRKRIELIALARGESLGTLVDKLKIEMEV